MDNLAGIVLAAGQGKRMKSRLPKVLHPLCGRPLLEHALAALQPLAPSPQVVVIGVGADEVRAACEAPAVTWALQAEQRGTGHAAMCAREALEDFAGDVLVTCGDIPLVRPETWQRVVAEHRRQGVAATLVSALFDDPTGYGRVVRDEAGQVRAIVEEADCDETTRGLREGNVSLYCFQAPALFWALDRLRPDNEQGEYYLTDAIAALVEADRPVAAVIAEDPIEVMGINDRVALAQAERVLRDRLRRFHMLNGVTLMDPATTYIDVGVEIGRDTVIYPGALLLGRTRVGEDCLLGDHVLLRDSEIGDGSEIKHCSVVSDSRVGRQVQIGPCAHVRDHSTLAECVRVGTSSEVVRSRLGPGVKDLHFSYLGDATVGAEVNVGAGVITCNYDGRQKHPTIIGDGCFIGSDAAIVAPVTIGDGAYVAAGSVINKDVPPGALGIGRSKQENKEGWAERKSKG